MQKKIIPIRDLFDRPIDVETGTPLKVVVKRLKATRLEMEDAHFNHESAVLLPDPRLDSAGAGEEGVVTGLSVIQSCYRYAEANPSQKLLLTGHADTTGKPDYNLTLSALRAKNTLAVLLGDKTAFSDICVKQSKVEDYQAILGWAFRHLGWDCDPGTVDGKHGVRTTAALRGFKKHYNTDFGAKLPLVGSVGPETWKAFFDTYALALQALLKTDAAGLAKARSRVKFVDDGKKSVGCGESHPIEAASKNDYRSRANRRVEFLFFEPGDVPKFPCHDSETSCKPHLCELYSLGFFEITPALPKLEGEAVIRLVKLTTDEPAAGVTALVEMPDGTVVEKVADGDGVVKLEGLTGQKFKLVGIKDDAEQQLLASIDNPTVIA